MDRRAVVASLLAAPLLARPAVAAESRRKRVGFIVTTYPQDALIADPMGFPASRALVEILREKGWRAGENVEFIWRSAEGDFTSTKLDAIYRELIAIPVDVLVVSQNPHLHLALARTRSIPIVMNNFGASDRLRNDGSKDFPANLTGTTWAYADTYSKLLELLKAAAPEARSIAVAIDERLGIKDKDVNKALGEPVRRLDVALIHAPYDLDAPELGLDRARAAGARALCVLSSPGTGLPARQKALIGWIRRNRMTAIHGNLEAAEIGGLMAYGPNLIETYQRTAHIVDRVLRGTRPADIPLERPKEVKLYVNLEAARAIGVTLPPQIVLLADKVIG